MEHEVKKKDVIMSHNPVVTQVSLLFAIITSIGHYNTRYLEPVTTQQVE
jgi:hypothetical protein